MLIKNLTNPFSEPYEIQNILTFGRAEECHVRISNTFAEERHARIEIKEDKIIIRDLRSKNGTYVNGVRVLESYIDAGDVIKIANTEFILEDPNQICKKKYLISNSKHWGATLTRLPQFAKSDLPVLLLGPSGSGKEILAQAVHDLSYRKNNPVVKVNCSALTEALVESELFGHVKGSYTGASQDRKGAFETARNGTLVLDEVGDLPLELQPKLLRALENKEIKPVGCDRVITTNVRIIASTHQDLKAKVDRGLFRKDLFFRLNVIQIKVPALSERMEDFEKILFEFAKDMRVKFSHAAIEILKKHDWPGNIRELRNLVARMSTIKRAPEVVSPNDVEQILDEKVVTVEQLGGLTLPKRPKGNLIKEIEKQMITQRLLANNGNQRQTASDLGIAKSTLYDRLKTYNININKLLAEKILQNSG